MIRKSNIYISPMKGFFPFVLLIHIQVDSYIQVGQIANPSSFGWMVDGVCDGFADIFRWVPGLLPNRPSVFYSLSKTSIRNGRKSRHILTSASFSMFSHLPWFPWLHSIIRFIAFIFVLHRALQSGKQGSGYSLLPVEIDTGWSSSTPSSSSSSSS